MNSIPTDAEVTRVAQALIPDASDAAMTLSRAHQKFVRADAQANRDVAMLYNAIERKDAHPTTRTIAEYLAARLTYAQSLEALAQAEAVLQAETLDDAVASEFCLELYLACAIAGVPVRRPS